MPIPHNLIVFFHDFEQLPERSAEALATTTTTNPHFSQIRIDDAAARDLIADHAPHLADLYGRIRVPACRSDLIRLLALYVFGGLYIDIAMAYTSRFEKVFDFSKDVVLVRRDDNPAFRGRPHVANIVNSIMLCAKDSPFALACLKKAVFNVSSGMHNYMVNVATGPAVIHGTYNDMKADLDAGLMRFSEINGPHCRILRTPGVNNAWAEQQVEGIIDPGYFTAERPDQAAWRRMAGG